MWKEIKEPKTSREMWKPLPDSWKGSMKYDGNNDGNQLCNTRNDLKKLEIYVYDSYRLR